MIKRWLRKYFVTVFVLATFMGVFHHHNDMQTHEDCKICTIQSNIANADTPSDVFTLPTVIYVSQTPLTLPQVEIKRECRSTFNSRAPPYYS